MLDKPQGTSGVHESCGAAACPAQTARCSALGGLQRPQPRLPCAAAAASPVARNMFALAC